MLSAKRARLNLRNSMFHLRRRYSLDKQPKRVSSSSIILENEKGEALIVKANYKDYWTFPGGFIEANETPRCGAMREVLEEVGITVNPEKLEFVAVIDRVSSIAQTYQFIFKTVLTEEMMKTIVLQASEIDEYFLVTKDQVALGDRYCNESVHDWAAGKTGYIEQFLKI
jgi:ADP-ribose pyrophosphatase YjhB (NUDIX family)